jgi:hypothetical protein
MVRVFIPPFSARVIWHESDNSVHNLDSCPRLSLAHLAQTLCNDGLCGSEGGHWIDRWFSASETRSCPEVGFAEIALWSPGSPFIATNPEALVPSRSASG